LNIDDYPDVKERLLKSSMRYYLSKNLYKGPKSDDYMSLARIEDLFLGFKPMLSYLVDDLVWKGKVNEAKGICIRNNLEKIIREDTYLTLSKVVYDPNREPPLHDPFGPVSEGNFISLPPSVKVEWIGSEKDVALLDYLLT